MQHGHIAWAAAPSGAQTRYTRLLLRTRWWRKTSRPTCRTRRQDIQILGNTCSWEPKKLATTLAWRERNGSTAAQPPFPEKTVYLPQGQEDTVTALRALTHAMPDPTTPPAGVVPGAIEVAAPSGLQGIHPLQTRGKLLENQLSRVMFQCFLQP
jgi:hypothetical protein